MTLGGKQRYNSSIGKVEKVPLEKPPQCSFRKTVFDFHFEYHVDSRDLKWKLNTRKRSVDTSILKWVHLTNLLVAARSHCYTILPDRQPLAAAAAAVVNVTLSDWITSGGPLMSAAEKGVNGGRFLALRSAVCRYVSRPARVQPRVESTALKQSGTASSLSLCDWAWKQGALSWTASAATTRQLTGGGRMNRVRKIPSEINYKSSDRKEKRQATKKTENV